jgi:hypothetical protein
VIVARRNSQRSVVAQTLWIGNATVGGILALLGGLLACETFGYRMYVVVFGQPLQAFYAGAAGAALGAAAMVASIWRLEARPARIVSGSSPTPK